MGTLIDSSVWIDYFHPKTPRRVRQIAERCILDGGALICEPVFAEIFHGMPHHQANQVIEHLETVPMLLTPLTLWQKVVPLIRACTRGGNPVGTVDALIAVIALENDVTIVTFDKHFLTLQKHCKVKVELLSREI